MFCLLSLAPDEDESVTLRKPLQLMTLGQCFHILAMTNFNLGACEKMFVWAPPESESPEEDLETIIHVTSNSRDSYVQA